MHYSTNQRLSINSEPTPLGPRAVYQRRASRRSSDGPPTHPAGAWDPHAHLMPCYCYCCCYYCYYPLHFSTSQQRERDRKRRREICFLHARGTAHGRTASNTPPSSEPARWDRASFSLRSLHPANDALHLPIPGSLAGPILWGTALCEALSARAGGPPKGELASATAPSPSSTSSTGVGFRLWGATGTSGSISPFVIMALSNLALVRIASRAGLARFGFQNINTRPPSSRIRCMLVLGGSRCAARPSC
jgi:hypothetical protein